MKLAFIIFNDITSLDFVGIYDPVSRLRSLIFYPILPGTYAPLPLRLLIILVSNSNLTEYKAY